MKFIYLFKVNDEHTQTPRYNKLAFSYFLVFKQQSSHSNDCIILMKKKHLPAGGWYVTCFYISAGRSVGPTAASFTIIVCKLRCPQLCPKYFLFPILKHNSGL